MVHLYFAPFFIYVVAGYNVLAEIFTVLESSSDKLKWPDTYTVKATKYSLTSNLVEDFQEWATNSCVRIDYNNGAVKVITLDALDESKIQMYEIHPESKEGNTSELVCNKLEKSLTHSTILPSTSSCDAKYKLVGNETLFGKKTVKFEFVVYKPIIIDLRKTLWAYYSHCDDVWIPVRYEEKRYNPSLGSLISHEVWEYTDFSLEVDADVFHIVDDICNDNNTVNHDMDSEKVTRELMFINPHNNNHVEHVYSSFVNNFARASANEEEQAIRKAVFQQNMRMVSTVNKKKLGYTLAINQFSDRTPEEINRSMGLRQPAPGESGNIPFPYDEETTKLKAKHLPSSYDARVLGLVGTVKHQRTCGSCWTYGTTAAMEGALARANGGRLMSLSNQALVDCVWKKYGGGGCRGGQPTAAYKWMKDYGLPTEEQYGPYKNKEDYCHIKNVTRMYPIRGYTIVPSSNEAAKVAVVEKGPLSTCVHVTPQFTHYSSGIFYEYECDHTFTTINHMVALVGYGKSKGQLFWILKNSWGPTWGMSGYMHISAKDNTCGITTHQAYVVL